MISSLLITSNSNSSFFFPTIFFPYSNMWIWCLFLKCNAYCLLTELLLNNFSNLVSLFSIFFLPLVRPYTLNSTPTLYFRLLFPTPYRNLCVFPFYHFAAPVVNCDPPWPWCIHYCNQFIPWTQLEKVFLTKSQSKTKADGKASKSDEHLNQVGDRLVVVV